MSRRLTITCERCKAELDHRCNVDLLTAIVDLHTWGPERGMPDYMIREGKRARMYGAGDEDAPFMTEAFLYTALGKEDARTLLALVNAVVTACGLDQMGIYKAINERLESIKLDREQVATQQRRQQLLREIRNAKPEGVGIPEDEWPLLTHLAKCPERWQIGEPYERAGRQWKKFTDVDKREP